MSVVPFPTVGSGYPDPRSIRHALNVLQRLPAEALADLTERLIDRLDALGPDPDLEPEEDVCEAGECGGFLLRSDGLPGDSTDAEPDEDRGADADEPRFPNDLRYRLDRLLLNRRPMDVRKVLDRSAGWA